jgi:hypothetical protein
MIDLGTTRAPSTLNRVTLTLDEMDLLLDRLQIDELPVVLNAVPRFDNKPARDASFAHAEAALAERGLIEHGEVHPELAERLAILGHPHWVVALRLFAGESISRLCIAKGAESTVLALRGPESFVIDDAGQDLAGVVLAALGPAEALAFESFSAPTAELSELFNDTRDPAETSRRLAAIALPARDSNVVASAMVHCYGHTEIVGIAYGEGTRDQAEGHLAVFDTRNGRFVATATRSSDGTKWSSLSSGSNARLRQAVETLIAALPMRTEFTRLNP